MQEDDLASIEGFMFLKKIKTCGRKRIGHKRFFLYPFLSIPKWIIICWFRSKTLCLTLLSERRGKYVSRYFLKLYLSILLWFSAETQNILPSTIVGHKSFKISVHEFNFFATIGRTRTKNWRSRQNKLSNKNNKLFCFTLSPKFQYFP